MFGRLTLGTAAILVTIASAAYADGAATAKTSGKPVEGRAVYVSPAGAHMLRGNDFGPDFNVSPVRPTTDKSSPA